MYSLYKKVRSYLGDGDGDGRRVHLRGFTMIELLVVIAIIGILAVAVLSAINPIEQINKGRDTRSRSDAQQLLQATERYFAVNELFPWNVAATGFTPGSTVYTTLYYFDGTTAGANWNWINNLLTTSEIKPTFSTRLTTGRVHKILKAAGTNSSTYVCFTPTSKAFSLEADRYCQTNGAAINAIQAGTCLTTNGNPPATGTNPICIP